MAFTAEEQNNFATMLNSTPSLVGAHITSLGDLVTAELETAVREQLNRWKDGTVKGRVWFEGNSANKGFNMSPVDTADTLDPTHALARLLEWPYLVVAPSMGTLQIG